MSCSRLVSSIPSGLPAREAPLHLAGQAGRLERIADGGEVLDRDRTPIAQGPDLAEALLDEDRGLLAASRHAGRDHDRVAGLPHALGLEADGVHVVPEGLEVAAYPLVAAIGVGLGRELRRYLSFELGIDELEDALDVIAAQRFESAPHHV